MARGIRGLNGQSARSRAVRVNDTGLGTVQVRSTEARTVQDFGANLKLVIHVNVQVIPII